MDKRQRNQNKQNEFKRYKTSRTISKSYVTFLSIFNFGFYIIFGSWGNLVIALFIALILFLWTHEGEYLRIKNILREFSLFNTWVIMKFAIKFCRDKNHPWKKNPPTLKNWIECSTILNEDMSYIITTLGVIVIPLIIWGLWFN